jgi:hypothetical protein
VGLSWAGRAAAGAFEDGNQKLYTRKYISLAADSTRSHRPRRETLPQVDLRVVQPVPGRQRPPAAEPVTGGAVGPGPASQPVGASWRPHPGATALGGKRSPKSICGSYNQSRATSAHPRPSRSPVAPLAPVQRRNRWAHPGAHTPATPPSLGNAPASRFAGRTTSPGPPAPTCGRAGHRWRRWPRPGVATGESILAPTPRRHRPRRFRV